GCAGRCLPGSERERGITPFAAHSCRPLDPSSEGVIAPKLSAATNQSNLRAVGETAPGCSAARASENHHERTFAERQSASTASLPAKRGTSPRFAGESGRLDPRDSFSQLAARRYPRLLGPVGPRRCCLRRPPDRLDDAEVFRAAGKGRGGEERLVRG